jgi:hypothetical protein
VCASLAAQFAFFSRADSGVLLTSINAQASVRLYSLHKSIRQKCRHAIKQHPLPEGAVSPQDDPGNCFNKLQLRWKMLRGHSDTNLYWFFEDDPWYGLAKG